MSELFDFFFTNDRLRWKVYLAVGNASLIYGLVNLWVFHRNEERVFSETVWVLLLALLCTISVVQATKRRIVATEAPSRRLPRASLKLVAAGGIAVALLTNMIRIDVPHLQASLADFGLARIAAQIDSVQAANLSPEQLQARFRRVGTIVAVSSANQIPVDSGTLKMTQSALSRYLMHRPLPGETNQAGWAAAIDLQVLALKRDVQTGLLLPRTLPKEGYVFNSRVEIDRDLALQGEHSTLVVNDQIGIKGASVSFDKIDFKANWNPLVLMDDRSRALVNDSTFRGGTQVLDRIIWVNVRFKNAMILYNEGPLRLRNVSFTDCDLRNLDMPFHRDQELLRRIREANGRPLTYVYDPVIPSTPSTP